MDQKKLQNLTPKERMEAFQSSINQMIQENQAKNVRQLLHQRYLEAKSLEEEKKKNIESVPIIDKKETSKQNPPINRIKIGKQLAKVFRFETNQLRNRRRQQRNLNEGDDIDPLLNDPNVLFENFAYDDNDEEQHNEEDLPFFPEDPSNPVADDDEIDDDSFKSLISTWIRHSTRLQITFLILKIFVYIFGQKLANSYGFGAPFLIVSILIIILTNLRRKSPGELSAYSVFNPNCRSIPTVAGSDQPREQILLGFGPL